MRKVENILKQALQKNKKELESALIRPLSDEWPFSTNGVYFFVGKMGSGKSYSIWKHILVCENLFDHPVYTEIIYCSTSGKMDKTAEAFSKKVKTPIKYVDADNLMSMINKHLKRKNKFYSMARFVLSRMKQADDEVKRLIIKHNMTDILKVVQYTASKMAQYGFNDYPFNTLLVLDDFAGNVLLMRQTSPLVQMMTKTRHYNITVIIVAQTIRFIPLNVKRLCTDMIVFSKFSDEDFKAMLEQTPNNLNVKQTLSEYKTLTGNHDHFILNITADRHWFVRE